MLASAGYQAWAIDLPGYGKSPAANIHPRHGWRNCSTSSAFVRRLLAASMSGAYAFPLVTEHPGRVACFVAVAPVQSKPTSVNSPESRFRCWPSGARTTGLFLGLTANCWCNVPNGRMVIIPGGSHAPYMSDPARFHAELLKFLDECRLASDDGHKG